MKKNPSDARNNETYRLALQYMFDKKNNSCPVSIQLLDGTIFEFNIYAN